jgi:hypothetical protein
MKHFRVAQHPQVDSSTLLLQDLTLPFYLLAKLKFQLFRRSIRDRRELFEKVMKRLDRIAAIELQDWFDNWTYRHSVTRQIILT